MGIECGEGQSMNWALQGFQFILQLVIKIYRLLYMSGERVGRSVYQLALTGFPKYNVGYQDL